MRIWILLVALAMASMGCRDSASPAKTTSIPKPAVTADVTPEETPAARQFAAWLAVFNAGDRDALIAYHEKYFPYDAASDDVHGIEHEFGLSQGTGGFDLKKPEKPTPT